MSHLEFSLTGDNMGINDATETERVKSQNNLAQLLTPLVSPHVVGNGNCDGKCTAGENSTFHTPAHVPPVYPAPKPPPDGATVYETSPASGTTMYKTSPLDGANIYKPSPPDGATIPKTSPLDGVNIKHLPGVALSGQEVYVAPDGGWGWVVMFANWCINIICCGMDISATLFYQAMLERYSATPMATAYVFSIQQIVKYASSPLVSMLYNAYPGQTIPLLGSVCMSAAHVASAYAPSIHVLYFTVGVGTAIGMNLIVVPTISELSLWFDKNRGRVVAFAMSGCGLGGMALAPMIEYLLGSYGYSGGMLIIAGVTLNCCVGAALVRPAPLPSRRKHAQKFHKSSSMMASNGGLTVHEHHKDQLPAHVGNELTSSYPSLAVCKPISKSLLHELHTIHEHTDRQRSHVMSHASLVLETSPGKGVLHRKGLTNVSSMSHSLPCLMVENKIMLTKDIDDTRPKVGDCNVTSYSHVTHPSESVKMSCKYLMEQTGFDLMGSGQFFAYCVLVAGYFSCYSAVITLLSGYCKENGLSDADTAYLLSIANGCSIVTSILSGFLLDAPFLKHHKFSFLMLVICMACLCCLLTPSAHSQAAIYAVATATHCLLNAMLSLSVSLIPDLVAPERVCVAYGLVRCFLGLGGFIGPAVGAALTDYSGTYGTFYYFGGTIFLLTALLFQCVHCRYKTNISYESHV